MGRSFDITRRQKPAPSSAPAPRRRRRSSSGIIFLFLIIGVGVVYYFLQVYQTNPVPVKGTNNKPISPIITTIPSPISSPTSAPKSDLKIQILNGTGVDTVTEQVKSLLVNNGYPVESAALAQYEYAQTYIYYRQNSVEVAKAISKIISAYEPSLSESQIAGLFDILIIVGKKNLPVNP